MSEIANTLFDAPALPEERASSVPVKIVMSSSMLRMAGAREPFWRPGATRLVVITWRDGDNSDLLIACGIDPDISAERAIVFKARFAQSQLCNFIAAVTGSDKIAIKREAGASGIAVQLPRRNKPTLTAARAAGRPRSPSQGDENTPEPAQEPTPDDGGGAAANIVVIPDPPPGGNGPKKASLVWLAWTLAAADTVAGGLEHEGSDSASSAAPANGDGASSRV